MTTDTDFHTEEYWTALIEQTVAEKGEDYVYPRSRVVRASCQYLEYVEGGPGDDFDADNATGPSCLIGTVLYMHGQKVDALADIVVGLVDAETQNAEIAVEHVGLKSVIPYNVVRAFSCAQNVQDAGNTWGEALEAYKRNL